MHEPPCTREIWFYILRKVNFKDSATLKRGQGFFRYSDIMKDLCWYVGYREQTYSKTQIAKSLRRLREGNAIETTKTTRGVLITVLNYSVYQNPQSYEGNNEGNTKETRRQQCDNTITKERIIKKKEEYSCEFQEFWAAYPKKKSKDRAWTAWKNRRKEIPDNVAAIVRENIARNKNWKKNGGQYIPYPASWINAGGWMDELEPAVVEVNRAPDWY